MRIFTSVNEWGDRVSLSPEGGGFKVRTDDMNGWVHTRYLPREKAKELAFKILRAVGGGTDARKFAKDILQGLGEELTR